MKLQELKEKIEETFPEEQSKVLKEMVHFMDELVKVSDFNELKSIVKELAEDQKEMRQQLKELAEAQKKTEEQVKQLVEAQKQLAEDQKEMRQQLKELAEAQKRTEEELRALAHEHRITRQELGKLSHSFGYLLEDRAYKSLPVILENQYGIKVITPLTRQIFNYREDKSIEINLLGKGLQNQEEIWIIGEAKSQLGKKHVDEFIQKRYIYDELFPGKKFYIMITYITHPKTKKYAEENHIHVFYSYEFSI